MPNLLIRVYIYDISTYTYKVAYTHTFAYRYIYIHRYIYLQPCIYYSLGNNAHIAPSTQACGQSQPPSLDVISPLKRLRHHALKPRTNQSPPLWWNRSRSGLSGSPSNRRIGVQTERLISLFVYVFLICLWYQWTQLWDNVDARGERVPCWWNGEPSLCYGDCWYKNNGIRTVVHRVFE